MMARRTALMSLSLTLLLAATSALAQAPLSPAPMLGLGKDADGRPLPFGFLPTSHLRHRLAAVHSRRS